MSREWRGSGLELRKEFEMGDSRSDGLHADASHCRGWLGNKRTRTWTEFSGAVTLMGWVEGKNPMMDVEKLPDGLPQGLRKEGISRMKLHLVKTS